MKKIILLLFLALTCPLWAKRLPPPFLLPVDDGIYRFVIRENAQPNKNHVYKGGHVVAYLKATGEVLWDKYLYKVQMDPKVEADVQNIFIHKMYLEKPNLLILENERHEWFALYRRTGEKVGLKDVPRKADDPSVYYTDPNRVEPLLKDDFLILAADAVSYGRQKVMVYDVSTGKLVWEKKLNVPKIKGAKKGEGNRIEFMYFNKQDQLEITFWDSSECLLDPKTEEVLKRSGK